METRGTDTGIGLLLVGVFCTFSTAVLPSLKFTCTADTFAPLTTFSQRTRVLFTEFVRLVLSRPYKNTQDNLHDYSGRIRPEYFTGAVDYASSHLLQRTKAQNRTDLEP
jgi:hypothetical protein